MRRDEILRDEVRAVDLGAISSVADIVVAMDDASFQARALGQVARIWEEMLREDVTVFIGLSGAMIAGGLRKVIVDLLRRNMADVVVSTGAILYQDLYQSLGHRHYRGSVDAPDVELHSMMIDRIYDTYIDEDELRICDDTCKKIADSLDPRPYSSRETERWIWSRCSLMRIRPFAA